MKKMLLPLLVSSLFASDINLEISNHTLGVNVAYNLPTNESFQIKGDYLYDDESNKDNYFSIGFGAIGENALDDYNSKLSIFMSLEHTTDNTALPIGVGIFNDNFGNIDKPLFAKFEIAFAPSVLSFQDADKFFKTKIEFGVKPIENGKLFIGYKDISFTKNYLSTIYAGVGFIW